MAGLNLLELSAVQLQQLMESRQLTCVRLVKACLSQIEAYDRQGPCIKAIISTAPTGIILKIAQTLDEERLVGHVRSPLHGIPIILKASRSLLMLGYWDLVDSR